MGGLKNAFSWSFSAGEDFEQCRRRRYWNKYAMWGGWVHTAAGEQKTAYRLSKMDNRWGLMGQAVENAIMWILKQHQQGKAVNADSGWKETARPFLTKKWNESIERSWLSNAKKFCCLREHYYKTLQDENEAKRQVADQVRRCIGNFTEKMLPRIGAVPPNWEWRIATPEQPGDVEHFVYEGVKIYAIPDYVYKAGDELHIHDWKAGKIKADHIFQLSLYALWANIKHGVPLKKIFLYVEYLNEGRTLPFQVSEERMEEIKERINGSIGSMTEYLVDGDRNKNEPLPKEEWELTADPAHCQRCNFLELCRPELDMLESA